MNRDGVNSCRKFIFKIFRWFCFRKKTNGAEVWRSGIIGEFSKALEVEWDERGCRRKGGRADGFIDIALVMGDAMELLNCQLIITPTYSLSAQACGLEAVIHVLRCIRMYVCTCIVEYE